MAGLASAIDLLLKRRHPLTTTTTTTTIVSKGLSALAATVAASSAVSFLGPSSSPSLVAHFNARDWTGRVAYCDAAMVDADSWEEEETMCDVPIRTNKYPAGKKYDIELKPLLSAFRPKALGATTVRALLVNFFPLLGAYSLQLLGAYLEPEDDDEFEEDLDRPARPPMPDAVVPLTQRALKRSVTYIVREVSVITTGRILGRVAMCHATDRTAWKLLKDISKSVIRKAGRDLSPAQMFAAVCKTTFRAHALGVLANWMVQLSIDFSRSVYVSRTVQLKEGKWVGLDSKELQTPGQENSGQHAQGECIARLGFGGGCPRHRPHGALHWRLDWLRCG